MSSLSPILLFVDGDDNSVVHSTLRSNERLLVVQAHTVAEAGRYLHDGAFRTAVLIASSATDDALAYCAIAARADVALTVFTDADVSQFPSTASVYSSGQVTTDSIESAMLGETGKATVPVAATVGDADIRRFFDLTPDMLCVVGADGRFLMANEGFERLLGYSKAELFAHSVTDLVHSDDLATTRTRLAQIASDTQVIDFENRYLTKSGSYRWLSWIGFRDSEKHVTYGAARDITKRKEIEAELKLRDDAMRVSGDGIMIADCGAPDMPLVYVNPAFERITGYSAEESIGKNPRFLRGSTLDQPGVRIIRRALAEGQSTSAVVLNRRKDGGEFWNELRLSPIHSDNGLITHYVGILNDITDRTIMEQALRESQERLSAILGSVKDVVYSLPMDGNADKYYYSPAVIQVTGLRPDQLYANPHLWYDAVHPDDRVLLEKRDQAVAAEFAAEAEYRIRHVNGKLSWLYDRAVLVHDAAGMPTRIDGIATDITEQKHLRQTVIQAEKLAALGELIAGVAHEVNNPLAIISGHAQILEMTQTGIVKEDAQTILKMANRASEIVRNLLAFARKQDGQRQMGALNDVVRAALELAEYRLVRHGVNLTVELQERLPPIVMNATEMQQVLINLLTNADQALRNLAPEARRVTVRTFTVVENDQTFVIMEVADQGPGIPDDVKHRIFDPFFTTKGVGEGTGLGLSICHGIVVAHGGSIRVTSGSDSGTTIMVKLPAGV